MQSYLTLLTDVLRNGEVRPTRNANVTSVFARQLQFDLTRGFPILTTKKMPFRSIAAEMIGFLRGCTNADDFEHLGTKVWWDNAEDPTWQSNGACVGKGDLGRIYGAQWRGWRTHTPILDDPQQSDGPYTIGGWQPIDQIGQLHDDIRNNPYSRRHIVTAWNPGELDLMCLPPCHLMFQVYVDPPYLDMMMVQRSADAFLGLPFNISGYSLLLWILAKTTGYEPRHLTMCLGDVHIYEQHEEAVYTQLNRAPSVSTPYINYIPFV